MNFTTCLTKLQGWEVVVGAVLEKSMMDILGSFPSRMSPVRDASKAAGLNLQEEGMWSLLSSHGTEVLQRIFHP